MLASRLKNRSQRYRSLKKFLKESRDNEGRADEASRVKGNNSFYN